MKRGIEQRAASLGYQIEVYSANNDAKREVEGFARAIKDKVDGIILSPTNSSAAVTLLRLAQTAKIPVVIADIGTESGEYVSYIASDNFEGSYQLGKLLVSALPVARLAKRQRRHHRNPQKTAPTAKPITAGFMKALDESGVKTADLRQQVNFFASGNL